MAASVRCEDHPRHAPHSPPWVCSRDAHERRRPPRRRPRAPPSRCRNSRRMSSRPCARCGSAACPTSRRPVQRVADDPRAAAWASALLRRAVQRQRAGVVATCHVPSGSLGRAALGRGVGTSPRRTMPVLGTAYARGSSGTAAPTANGRRRSGRSRAPVEHGGSRTHYVHVVAAHYRADYEAVFGPLPDLDVCRFPATLGPSPTRSRRALGRDLAGDRDAVSPVYANLGKAIAAYERWILPARRASTIRRGSPGRGGTRRRALTDDEARGCGCSSVQRLHELPQRAAADGPPFPQHRRAGRACRRPTAAVGGQRPVQADEFNCLGRSDAEPDDCRELRFLVTMRISWPARSSRRHSGRSRGALHACRPVPDPGRRSSPLPGCPGAPRSATQSSSRST